MKGQWTDNLQHRLSFKNTLRYAVCDLPDCSFTSEDVYSMPG